MEAFMVKAIIYRHLMRNFCTKVSTKKQKAFYQNTIMVKFRRKCRNRDDHLGIADFSETSVKKCQITKTTL